MKKNFTKVVLGASLATTLLLTGCSSNNSETFDENSTEVIEEIETKESDTQIVLNEYVTNFINPDNEALKTAYNNVTEALDSNEAYDAEDDLFESLESFEETEVKELRKLIDSGLVSPEIYDDKDLTYNEATAVRYYALYTSFKLYSAYVIDEINYDLTAVAPKITDDATSFNAKFKFEGDSEEIEKITAQFFPNNEVPFIKTNDGEWRVSGGEIAETIRSSQNIN